jgi:transcription antitermination factor NusG
MPNLQFEGAMATAICQSSSRWFAVYTASRQEKHVSTQLNHRQIECFLPLYQTVHRWKNRTKVTVELPLFPSYLFVRVQPERRGSVLSVAGVLSLVGSRREAWPLPDCEVEALRSAIDQRQPEPHEYLVVGERARIKVGPLTGMEGVLLRRKNGLRVVLTVEQIARSFSVEVDIGDVEVLSTKVGGMPTWISPHAMDAAG